MRGDAAGELDPGDGTWTEELRERYADRIVARLARQIPNLEGAHQGADSALAGRPGAGERQPRYTAIPTPARSRSTRTSSGAPSRRAPGTRRRSKGSGTSARARIRGRGWARARARSSPSSCSGRRCRSARSGGFAGSFAGEAALLDLADHDAPRELRGRPARLPRRGRRGDRDLGVQAAGRRGGGSARRPSRERAGVDERRPGRAVDRAAADAWPGRAAGAGRGVLRRPAAPGAVRAERGRAPHRTGPPSGRRRRACARSPPRPVRSG